MNINRGLSAGVAAMALSIALPALAEETQAQQTKSDQAAKAAQGSSSTGQMQDQRQLTAEEQSLLDSLPYNIRQDVLSRLRPDQTVEGVTETALLNRLANPDYKRVRNVVVVYRVEVQGDNGEWRLVEVNPVDYAIIEPPHAARMTTGGTAQQGQQSTTQQDQTPQPSQ